MNKYISKLMLALGLCTLFAFSACSDDKGNYTYDEKNVITIENIPAQTSLLAGAEYIDIKPVITSSIDGVISDNDPNYSFTYKRKDSEGNWVDMGDTKNLYLLATLSAGTHNCYFAVTDKRTGVQTITPFTLRATTITSEGWLVLCNEGPDEKARMDMLSQISVGRIIPTHDILRTESDVPQLYHATQIGYVRTYANFGSKLVMLTETGSYLIPTADNRAYGEITTVTPADELKINQFLAPTTDHPITYTVIPYASYGRPNAILITSKEGNAYAMNCRATDMAGAFELPINTSKRGEAPEYKVAPYVGATELRYDGLSSAYGDALLYDTDNKRFIKWSSKGLNENVGRTDDDSQGITQRCTPLVDPTSGKKFSFQTGMDLVCMLNTANPSGTVYCIMKDGNKRHVYAIDVITDEFRQLDAFEDIQAPNFDKATCFAASSQYSVIYYGYQNKIYSYNLSTKATSEITLGANEEVTMLKFNHYDEPWGVGSQIRTGFLKNMDEDTRNIYLARERQLIVGTYDSSVTDNNGGILRFYEVSNGGMTLTLKKDKDENNADRTWEFKGFAKIKDVRYKEVL